MEDFLKKLRTRWLFGNQVEWLLGKTGGECLGPSGADTRAAWAVCRMPGYTHELVGPEVKEQTEVFKICTAGVQRVTGCYMACVLAGILFHKASVTPLPLYKGNYTALLMSHECSHRQCVREGGATGSQYKYSPKQAVIWTWGMGCSLLTAPTRYQELLYIPRWSCWLGKESLSSFIADDQKDRVTATIYPVILAFIVNDSRHCSNKWVETMGCNNF